MGFLFGLIFGIMDIEDESLREFQEKLLKEENFCVPIGIVLGGISGLLATAIDNTVCFL